MNTNLLTCLLAGVAVSVPFVAYARSYRRHERRIYAIGLFVAALIYVAFAAGAGQKEAIGVELGGAALFGVVAWLGLRFRTVFLALGWIGHVAWDLHFHSIREHAILELVGGQSTYAPWWYPVACIGFDVFVGGFVAASFWGKR